MYVGLVLSIICVHVTRVYSDLTHSLRAWENRCMKMCVHSVCVCTVCNAELTESQQQMEQLASDTNIHPPSTSNKKYNMPSKPSTAAGVSVHRDVCVQTEPVATVSSSSQLAVTGCPSVTVEHHYGKEYLDPSPILPHVISPDTLEGMYQISSLADYSQKKQNKKKKKTMKIWSL